MSNFEVYVRYAESITGVSLVFISAHFFYRTKIKPKTRLPAYE